MCLQLFYSDTLVARGIRNQKITKSGTIWSRSSRFKVWDKKLWWQVWSSAISRCIHILVCHSERSEASRSSSCTSWFLLVPEDIWLPATPGLWGSRSNPPPSCSYAEVPSLVALLQRRADHQSDPDLDPCPGRGGPRPWAWSWDTDKTFLLDRF